MVQGKLIILRGNAGSGKSTVAARLRTILTTPVALIEQDYYRHQLLAPWGEQAFELRSRLMIQDARLLLAEGYTVLIEGVLPSKWFKQVYEAIDATEAHVFYFDVSFEETIRRHHGRDKASAFGEEILREWWLENDHLGVVGEQLLPEVASVDETIQAIRQVAGV